MTEGKAQVSQRKETHTYTYNLYTCNLINDDTNKFCLIQKLQYRFSFFVSELFKFHDDILDSLSHNPIIKHR